MTVEETAVDSTRRTTSRRRVLLVVLWCVVGFVALFAVAAAWRLLGVEKVAQVGEPVAIPGGTVTLTEIKHVEPSALGIPLPAGDHAVQATLTIAADAQAPLIASAQDFTIEGTGVPTPAKAENADPEDATVPRGQSVSMVLVFAVPDASSDLVMTTPGDGLLTADHDDHPGDE